MQSPRHHHPPKWADPWQAPRDVVQFEDKRSRPTRPPPSLDHLQHTKSNFLSPTPPITPVSSTHPPPPYSPTNPHSPISAPRVFAQPKPHIPSFVHSQPFWLLLYFVFNLALTLYNKRVLVKFPFPYTLTAVHALCGSIGGYVLLEQGFYVSGLAAFLDLAPSNGLSSRSLRDYRLEKTSPSPASASSTQLISQYPTFPYN